MKFRNLVSAAALSLLPYAASAATIVVPAAGTGPGANNSHWQSELTLHSAAPRVVTVTIAYHTGANASAPVTVTLQPRETLSISDIVHSRFGAVNGSGALVLEVADRDANALAVTSRTFNASSAGEFGQDIPAIDAADAAKSGDIATLPAPSSVATTRFNFGLYAVAPSTVKWELLRADGSVAATRDLTYLAGEHVQYNGGVEALFSATPQNNDTVYARIISGKAIAYGSAVNNTSGDPSFVPGIPTRADLLIHFEGIDTDGNGTIDIADADRDGVLDAPLDIFTSMFPTSFRVVAASELGQAVSFSIVASQAGVSLKRPDGTFNVIAYGDLKNTRSDIVIRGEVDGSAGTLTIPVNYR